VNVTVEVKNVGPMRGDRPVLLSIRRRLKVGYEAAVLRKQSSEEERMASWPLQWLVDFTKVRNVGPGESRRIVLKVTAQEGWLQWSEDDPSMAQGEYELVLGTQDVASTLTVDVRA
jgi:hypothetical protein